MTFNVDLYFNGEDNCVFLECIKTNDYTIASFAYDHLFSTVREKADAMQKTLTLQLVFIESDGTEHFIKKRVCEVQS